MIELAEKCKIGVVYLLLLSFVNIMTFIPGGNSHARNNASSSVSSYEKLYSDDNRSTVLELILENFAGLQDALPDSGKPDFSYHFFSLKFRTINWIIKNAVVSDPVVVIKNFFIIRQIFPSENPLHLPNLQHHNFIFRLTPF